jgi:Tol biopolymer transport system component
LLSDAAYKDPELSPDGSLLAVSSDDLRNGKRYIRLYDLTRRVSTRLTQDGNEETPVWSPDAKMIAYASRHANSGYIYRVPADGSKPPEVLSEGARMSPNSWSPDGRYLLYMNFEKGPPSIWLHDDQERKNLPLFPGAEAHFSPDGKWIAYTLRTGGVNSELFVNAFPDTGVRIQISTSGAGQARWSRDGRKLFYIAPDRKLMVVDVDTKGKFTASAPRPLFQTHITAPSYVYRQYDVSPSGDSFIINSLNPASPLTLLTNWTADLRKERKD